MKKIFLLSALLCANIGFTEDRFAQFCLNPGLESVPILADGRVVPLFTHANRIKKQIFSSKNCSQFSATALYCFLSFGQKQEIFKNKSCQPVLKVNHQEAQTLLGLNADEKETSIEKISFSQNILINRYHALKDKGLENSGLANDLAGILSSYEKLISIEKGEDWKILVSENNWVALNTFKDQTEEKILSSNHYLNVSEKRNLTLETIYEKTQPFSWAVLIALAGFLFSVLSVYQRKFYPYSLISLSLLFVIEIFGIVLRVTVSGRGPVTNMYETVMWSGFIAFFISSLLGLKWKNAKILAAGFAGNAICFFMMKFATGMLDSTIQPLVPVLRDNFWLSTHVTSITFSYGCFFLSWIVANALLINFIFKNKKSHFVHSLNEWNRFLRVAIQIGSVFLAAGVLLGGIWADYSWGRFWGWDPKETWSLISLIVYVMILHGRYVGWFKDIVFTMITAFGFMFILMAWFGVNYILATGLHSYGFSSGGALFLAIIFLAQLSVLGVACILNMKTISSAR